MTIKQAKFVKSSYRLDDLPSGTFPEYAFIGRSNVGKSSLINMLVGRKNLAKISTKPGKTRSINHFLINNSWFLVDLPGYGYAKVSEKDRQYWQKLIFEYLVNRPNLVNLFVLVDSRLDPQPIDLDFIRTLGLKQIPFAIVFTKIDKLSRNKIVQNVAKFKRALQKDWQQLPMMFLTSAVTGEGRQQLLDFIEQLNQDFDAFGRKHIKVKQQDK